ncbi:hypothetical protein ACSBR1_038247 [Camellia fascicularis]
MPVSASMIFRLMLEKEFAPSEYIGAGLYAYREDRELMAQAGVIADALIIVIISRIHQMNGQRDELKKFKDNIDQILPELLQKDSVLKMETKKELLIYKNGKAVLGDKGIAKLILQYKGCGRISELSKLLISIQKKVASMKEESLCSDVNDACINLGWLETAHDILDVMKL